ncbi:MULTISPECIES: hypothetical protein [unclassified Ruegeria]|uniref:hypothetical protein n=1 Tax=unclassified Ruegeria TaxID=2625375 RepID=UPI001489E8D5|nr:MULTISPECIES: hypothetical protein [unclassified Ruegeria]NOD62682.1 hypothetical protein [Ruegeria sp. HKCCD6109]
MKFDFVSIFVGLVILPASLFARDVNAIVGAWDKEVVLAGEKETPSLENPTDYEISIGTRIECVGVQSKGFNYKDSEWISENFSTSRYQFWKVDPDDHDFCKVSLSEELDYETQSEKFLQRCWQTFETTKNSITNPSTRKCTEIYVENGFLVSVHCGGVHFHPSGAFSVGNDYMFDLRKNAPYNDSLYVEVGYCSHQ